MKRFFLMSTLLLSALLVSAQTKVVPQMKKGMKKTYVTEASFVLPSNQSLTISSETVYEVTDTTSDGYILDIYITDATTNAKDAESRIYSLATEMLKGVHTKYTTDKEGKVMKVLEAEDVITRTNGMLDKVLSGVTLPESTNAGDLRQQLTGNLNEESLLESVRISTSPLALNGKTISTGTDEEYDTDQGIRMKRTYTVNGKNSIQSSAKINMSTEEMKKMMAGLFEKLLPELPDDFMETMGEMVKNLKLDASENATYTLGKDGWVKSITSESTFSSMGTSLKVNTKVTQK
ncbi:MAG: hypothetical protein IKW91_07785 [Bacteroidaceae bacterium]|nr:hypothetical protein [Bacteroidaceae bacterium]